MTVRSLGTQEMGEGLECLEELNCDPPHEVHHPPLVPRAKGTKEIERSFLKA